MAHLKGRRSQPLRLPDEVLVLSPQARQELAVVDAARNSGTRHGSLSLGQPSPCTVRVVATPKLPRKLAARRQLSTTGPANRQCYAPPPSRSSRTRRRTPALDHDLRKCSWPCHSSPTERSFAGVHPSCPPKLHVPGRKSSSPSWARPGPSAAFYSPCVLMTHQPKHQHLSPDVLLLDPENPRFPRSARGKSQAETLGLLIDRFKLDELADSILASGYLPFDPLVGFPFPDDPSKIVIAEGNRRLATLKLLLNPNLASDPTQHAKWKDFAYHLRSDQKHQIREVPVEVFETRDDQELSAYIGFRHVTGVLKWPAVEKAGFIAHLVDRHGWDFRKVARRLGSYAKHVERHHVAYKMVRQAHHQGIPGSPQMEGRFGVLLRALNSPGINNFLGIDYTGKPQRNPVQSEETQFRDFVAWTFGTENRDPLVTDSRQLSRWGQIIESPTAVRYLRTSDDPNLERAWNKSGGEEQSVGESLHTAADKLEEVVALVLEHKDNEVVRAGASRCARFMSQILAHFSDAKAKYFGDD